MDQISVQYLHVASDAQSQIADPNSVVAFVNRMQTILAKSSAPRKNFLLDSTTPHGDVVITEAAAMKPRNGWATLQVTEGIRRGVHEWCVKVENQGESTDGSGLMVGIVPKNYNKFDSFISQGGGWCLSRAGKLYGHWRRQEANVSTISFGTGDRVVLLFDYDHARLTVRVGKNYMVGELSNLTTEVFPAISLYYRQQHVRFEYHVVHDRKEQPLGWMTRQVLPVAAAFLPLSEDQLVHMTLDSYIFSTLFDDKTAGATEADAWPSMTDEGDHCAALTYTSLRAALARCTVLTEAFAAVRRCAVEVPRNSPFLDPSLTAEYLRRRHCETVRTRVMNHNTQDGASSGVYGGGALGNGMYTTRPAYDAALNCGAVMVVHLFTRAMEAAQGGGGTSQALLTSLVQQMSLYLDALPLFDLAECDPRAGRQPCSALAPEVLQLALDHIMARLTALPPESPLSACDAVLMELMVQLALQRGCVSEVLQACRLLLRFPAETASASLAAWLRRHVHALRPARDVPDLTPLLTAAAVTGAGGVTVTGARDPLTALPLPPSLAALPSIFSFTSLTLAASGGCGTGEEAVAEEEGGPMGERVTLSLPLASSTTVLAMSYANEFVYLQTQEGLGRWGHDGRRFVQVQFTQQPVSCCPAASHASVAASTMAVLLLTDRMAAEGIAMVAYNTALEVTRVHRLDTMPAAWPRLQGDGDNSQVPQLLTTGPEDTVILLSETQSAGDEGDGSSDGDGRVPATAVSRSEAQTVRCGPMVEMCCFTVTAAPTLLWRRSLRLPRGHTPDLTHCLLLRRPGLVDLGNPADLLRAVGGRVTVELWVMLLAKDDTATLYQHGDKSATGEVFLETTRLERCVFVRGGYRHDTRGACVVSAPLPPVTEGGFFHVALVFDGRWHLFLDGSEAQAGLRQGTHVALDRPTQRWTVGGNCTCLFAGLRVWTVARSWREVARDCRRLVAMNEPGLVCQLLFNERGGNVVFNYVAAARPRHGVCAGSYARVRCDQHPWQAATLPCARSHHHHHHDVTATNATMSRATTTGNSGEQRSLADDDMIAFPLLHDWHKLARAQCFCTATHLVLLSHVPQAATLSTTAQEVAPASDIGIDATAAIVDNVTASPTTAESQTSTLFPVKKGGKVLCFFDLHSGVLYPAMYYLDASCVTADLFACDTQSFLVDIRERSSAGLKDGAETDLTADETRCNEKVMLIDRLALRSQVTVAALATLPPPVWRAEEAVVGGGNKTHAPSIPDEGNSSRDRRLGESLEWLMATHTTTPRPFPYRALAMWLLQTLSLHAMNDDAAPTSPAAAPGDTASHLFVPLADDVGLRCVTEVTMALQEHFRVVKGPNARRALSVKDGSSLQVLMTALQVLLRLLRRVRDFALHPASVGLSVLSATHLAASPTAKPPSLAPQRETTRCTTQGAVTERSGTSNNNNSGNSGSSTRRRTSFASQDFYTVICDLLPHATTGAQGHDSGTAQNASPDENAPAEAILSMLGDLINEAESTFASAALGRLARVVLSEGIDLFMPDVRCRAVVLRNAFAPHRPERGAALQVFLQAVVRSLASPMQLVTLLPPPASPSAATSDRQSRVKPSSRCGNSTSCLAINAPHEERSDALGELCATADALLCESVHELQRTAMLRDSGRDLDVAAQTLTSLANTLGAVQLTLLSACQSPSSLPSGDTSPGALNLQYVQHYYGSLFQATLSALKCFSEAIHDRVNMSDNGDSKSRSKPNTTMPSLKRNCHSSPTSSPPSKPRDLQNAGLPPIVPAVGGVAVARDQRMSTTEARTLCYLVQHSFLSSVLHTALGALPLLFDVEHASWFLQQLDDLLTLADTLRHRPHTAPDDVADVLLSPTSAERVACERLYYALYFAAMWIAVQMSRWTPTVMTQAPAVAVGSDEEVVRHADTSLDTPPDDQGSVPPSSDLCFFCESAFLLGGLREGADNAEDDGGGGHEASGRRAGRTGASSAVVPSRAMAIQHAIDVDETYWLRLQQRLDALGPRVTSTMARLLVRLAGAAVYLGSTPVLERLSVKELQARIAAVVRRLIPVRNALLQDARTRSARDFAAQLDELQSRCDVLMRLVHPAEAAQMLSGCSVSLTSAGSQLTAQTVEYADVQHDGPSELILGAPCWRYILLDGGAAPHSPRQRWRWAVNAVRRWRRLHYASALTSVAVDLDAAVDLVSRVARSGTLSANAMIAACASRAALGRTRLQGLRQLLHLLHQAPALAKDVALLMRHKSEQAALHYTDGLNGCGAGLLLQLRCATYDLLHWLALHHQREWANTATILGAPGQAGATCTDGSHDMIAPVMALCAVVHRGWSPCDLDVLRRLGVVAALFRATGTIFATPAAVSCMPGRGPLMLSSDESASAAVTPAPLRLRTLCDAATLREHESVVTQYQQRTRLRAAAGARAAVASGSAGGEDAEATTPVLHRTGIERVQCMMWECLKSLALQCGRQYVASTTCTLIDRLACSAFLQDYLGILYNELCACLCYAVRDTAMKDAEDGLLRVRRQVQVICSLLSTLSAQLARVAMTFDRGLTTTAARLARLLCTLAEVDLGTAAGQSGLALSSTVQAACMRTAAQLLVNCLPCHAHHHFAPVSGTSAVSTVLRQLSDAPEAQRSAWGGTSLTLSCFLSLAVRRLLSVGQDDVVIHCVLAVHTILLRRPVWAAELASLAGRFRADLDLMTRDTVSAEERRVNGARLYICTATLGGCLYCNPVPGLPVHYVTGGALGSPPPPTTSAIPPVDTEEATEGQGIVLALSDGGGETGQEEGDVVALASLRATQPEYGEAAWTVDDGDVHTDADHVSLPLSASYVEEWPYAAHTPQYSQLVTDFIAPALMQFTELLPTRSAHLTAVELAALASMLTFTARLVATDAQQCAALVEQRCVARLNQCAMTLLARLPLTRPHLSDFAACTLTSLLRRQAQAGSSTGAHAWALPIGADAATSVDAHPSAAPLTAAPPPRETVVDVARGVLPGLGVVTSGVLPPPRSSTSAPGSPRPALFAGRGLGVMNLALAYDVNAIGSGAGGAIGYGFERLAQSFAMPLTMSSRFAATKVTSLAYTPLTPMLCFHVLPGGTEPRAGLRITPLQKLSSTIGSGGGAFGGRSYEGAKEQERAVTTVFPCWSDGMALEMAVLLCDQLYPELGEAVCMPSTWAQPGLRFPLLSLYADHAEMALLQLRIEDASLVCALHLGNVLDVGRADELCRLDIAAEDWDHFLYISVVIDHSSVLLTKGSESVSVALPPHITTQLEATLSRAGAVTRLVLGHDIGRTTDANAEIEARLPLESATLILVSGLRMWGSCVLKSSLRNIADFVKRNQSLHPFNPCEDTCFFCFTEGTGSAVQSIDGAYGGVLQGAVRWAFSPCPMETRLELDRKDRLRTGLPPATAAVSSSGASPFLLPRGELVVFLSALDESGVERLCTDLLLSLVAHWLRQVALEALQQCLSPGYVLGQTDDALPAGPVTPSFDPWLILDKKDTARQLANLLRYSDTGVLHTAHVHLLDQIVTQLLHCCVSHGDTGGLVHLVSETLDALCAVLPHGAEVIDTELPYPVRAVKGRHGPDAVLPLQLTNGGGGILVFNPRLPNQEQLAVFKDAAQKNTMMKYPDSQDGLPDCRIPPDTAWFYIWLFSMQASPGVVSSGRGRTAATVALSVSLRSLQAAVLHAIFLPLCTALSRHGDASYACVVPVLLRGRVMATLALHAASDRNWENCLHAASMLTALLEVWRSHPRVQPYDQIPLRVLLSHYNFPLMSELWRDVVAQETTAPRSLVTGTYNCYTQILFGLLTTAMRAECVWRDCSPAALVRTRWDQVLRCWRACTSPASRHDAAVSSLPPGTPPTSTAPVVTCRPAGTTRAVVPATIATVRIACRGSVSTSAQSEAAASPRRLRAATAAASGSESTTLTHFAPSTPHSMVGLDVLTASQPARGPVVTARQRGGGRWALRCDRDGATVRSSVGLARGRFYFEVYVTDSNCSLVVGVTTSLTWGSEMMGDALGQDADSWGFSGSRLCRFHQGYRNDFTSRAKWKVGDVVGILIDLELNRLYCLHNGVQVSIFEKFALKSNGGIKNATRDGGNNNAAGSGVTHACERAAQEQPTLYFPAVTFGAAGCEVNFGAAPFLRSFPLSFLPVDPAHCVTHGARRAWYLVQIAEFSTQLVAMERLLAQRGDHDGDDDNDDDINRSDDRVAYVRALSASSPSIALSGPLELMQRRVQTYCSGRRGPLTVSLLCSSPRAKLTTQSISIEDGPCVVRGSVAVYSGRWYYEVMAGKEAGLHVGWVVADVNDGEWGLGKNLGDDAYSWALEGKRMIARHKKRQLNLARHTWKEGDVVGCMLDCDAGTMSFSINGILQHEVHKGAGDGVLYRDLVPRDEAAPGEGAAGEGETGLGFTPAVGLDAKAEATFMWCAEDMMFLPEGYKALGATGAVTEALVDALLQPTQTPPAQGQQTHLMDLLRDVQHLAQHVNKTVELAMGGLASYTLRGFYRDLAGGLVQAHQPTDAPLRPALHPTREGQLVLLQLVSTAAEHLFPFAHLGAAPTDVEDLHDFVRGAPLLASLDALREYCLPFVGLRPATHFLQVGAAAAGGALAGSPLGGAENVKLSINRRRALAALRDKGATPQSRLQSSLFGQVYQLLANKGSVLFCTNKKMWSVAFFGEGADDVGGPYREALTQICRELMSTDLPLFLPSANQTGEMGESREVFVPNPRLAPPVQLHMYRFVGRLMAGCLRTAEPLALYLSSRVWKTLVGASPDMGDLERVDSATAQALRYLKRRITRRMPSSASDVTDEELDLLCPGGFTVRDDAGVEHELVRDGRRVRVCRGNVERYVRLYTDYVLNRMAEPQLCALAEGFHEVVPLYSVSELRWFELEELVCGPRDYDPDALLDAARYEGMDRDDSRVCYLRQVLRDFTRAQRAAFMRFVSGRERLPPHMRLRLMPDDACPPPRSQPSSTPLLAGMETLPAMPQGGQPQQQLTSSGEAVSTNATPSRESLTVSSVSPSSASPALLPSSRAKQERATPETGYDDARLPHASTCFYWLSLPRYSSARVLRDRLLFAIEHCLDIDADFRVRDQDSDALDENVPLLARANGPADDEFEDYSSLR